MQTSPDNIHRGPDETRCYCQNVPREDGHRECAAVRITMEMRAGGGLGKEGALQSEDSDRQEPGGSGWGSVTKELQGGWGHDSARVTGRPLRQGWYNPGGLSHSHLADYTIRSLL